MGRPGITYEQVAEAADRLVVEGRVGPDGSPTLAALREVLGTGSPNTIHSHLRGWKTAREASEVVGVPELPAGLVRAMREALQGVRAEARGQIAAALEVAQREAGELARAGNALETELDELRRAHAELTAEREQLLGRYKALTEELGQCKRELAEQMRAAENARLDLSSAQLQRETAQAQFEQLRADVIELRGGLERERSARTTVERELASASAAREALAERMSEANERNTKLEREGIAVRQALEAERKAHAGTECDLAAARAAEQAASARATDLQQRETALRQALEERDQALRVALAQRANHAPELKNEGQSLG